MIEALLVRTMPVYLDEFPDETEVHWKKAVRTAVKVEELPARLLEALELKHSDYWSGESYRQAAYDLTFNLDGRASQRVIRVINNMASVGTAPAPRPGDFQEANYHPRV